MSCHRIEFSRACTILALFGLALKTAPVATHAADDGPVTRSATRDWLIDGSSFEAAVRPGRDSDELVLENGLIRRTFRLAPNGATVGLDNLVTGEALLRGVKPEALITIDGQAYEVGGLSGQPNYAYLLPEWLDEMKANPTAMQYVGNEVGEPKARLAWKQVRHHAPGTHWPPPGIHLRMEYRLPVLSASQARQLASGNDLAQPDRTRDESLLPVAPVSQFGRELLISDDFATRDPAWSVHASQSFERSSFENEGKLGEIYTPANTAVYAERPLPKGTGSVEVTIDAGTDRSASWGPGIALRFDGRSVKFNLRPIGGGDDDRPRLGGAVDDRELNRVGGNLDLDLSRPWTLRMRILDDRIFCDARREGGEWRTYHVYRFPTPLGEPVAVRIGKMDPQGGAADHADPGVIGRLRLISFAAYGELSDEALDRLLQRVNQRDLRVSVHYELYDGIPVMSKWISVENRSEQPVVVDHFTSEQLAIVEHANWVETREGVPLPEPQSLHVESDFAFGGFNFGNANRHIVHWRTDPQYATQVNYLRQQPCLLVVEPTYGPAQEVRPDETFESCRAFELVYDSTDRERRGLALRRMYRTIAPWVTENPLMHHLQIARPDVVRQAIDQAAEVGFEMIILSFGSGFNMENDQAEYLATWKSVADYADSKGVELGAYSLLSSRRIGGGNDIVSPAGQRPTHGNCPALTSEWGQNYLRTLRSFFAQTGFELLEHDGSYPGDVDITPRPPLQKGEQDSRWVQWRLITDFYQDCRAKGIYLNVPDYYFLAGSNKCGMGYREVNWSLPREMQVIHTRQNIFDGTWTKTPSMGWMFVPLTEYHGGGAAATIEPLSEHLDHYEQIMMSNLAMGVQACYRGPRLYDTEQTKAMVKRSIAWFKTYRDILESDIVHGRRADGRDLDWVLHANPQLAQKGMLVVFNPLNHPVRRNLRVNLYYTGLTETAKVSGQDGSVQSLPLDRQFHVELPVEVGGQSMTWFVIE